jgi:CBS domain-containing protein
MTPIVITVAETAKLSQVIRTMLDRKVHRVLVRNDDGEIVGIVSALDILHSMLAEPSVEALSTIA